MVTIIIPIYKENPTPLEEISILQTFKVLGGYDIVFIYPEGLNLTYYETQFPTAQFKVKAFEPFYFKGIYGYNRLMLSIVFYQSFTTPYLLICQTDAFIFKNTLDDWMRKDYDYVGAPWLRRKNRIPLFKQLWDNTLCFFKTQLNYRGNQLAQKNKSLLYNEVGNGGLSLRKRETFIKILNELPEVVKIYLKPENKQAFYAEDVFFSIEPQRHSLNFKKPSYREACLFAIENKQEKAFAFNKGVLPMGCHRWDKELDFWLPYIEAQGYNIRNI